MKRAIFSHPKTLGLASRLGISRAHAVGIIALLWDFTAVYTPRGNIGRYDDAVIAGACDWTTVGTIDATAFVTALVDSGFLDRCSDHRLIVHDWSQHVERWVLAKLEKTHEKVITVATTVSTTVATTDATSSSPSSSSLVIQQPKPVACVKFSIPTKDEIVSYIVEKKINVDPELFHAYYESNGWRVGKNPMKNWQAAVITWSRNAKFTPTAAASKKTYEVL